MDRTPPLFRLARTGNLADVYSRVAYSDLSVTQHDEYGNNLLMVVANLSPWIGNAQRYDLQLVQHLLHNGVHVDDINNRGQSALFLAVVAGNWGIAKILTKNHADVNLITNQGDTVLMRLIEWNRVPNYYWEDWQEQVNVDQSNKTGQTPLGRAIRTKRWYWVRWLMDRYAAVDVNLDDKWMNNDDTPCDIKRDIQNLMRQQERILTQVLIHAYQWHSPLVGIVRGYMGNRINYSWTNRIREQ
jgi:hypothetical protein